MITFTAAWRPRRHETASFSAMPKFDAEGGRAGCGALLRRFAPRRSDRHVSPAPKSWPPCAGCAAPLRRFVRQRSDRRVSPAVAKGWPAHALVPVELDAATSRREMLALSMTLVTNPRYLGFGRDHVSPGEYSELMHCRCTHHIAGKISGGH